MSDLKYWKFEESGGSYRRDRIELIDKEDEVGWNRVLQIGIDRNTGDIVFEENCDNYFRVYLPPQQAIEALEEAIAWIKEQT